MILDAISDIAGTVNAKIEVIYKPMIFKCNTCNHNMYIIKVNELIISCSNCNNKWVQKTNNYGLWL